MIEGKDFHDVIQVVIIVDQEVFLVSARQRDIQTDDGHLFCLLFVRLDAVVRVLLCLL